jgi:hypothetical protein
MLKRDSSFFKNMFSIHQGSKILAQEASSASQPLILGGDLAVDFKELCSILYAL